MSISNAKLRALSLFEDYVLLAAGERTRALDRLREAEPDVHLALAAMLAADAGTNLLDHPPPDDLLERIAEVPAAGRDPRLDSRIGPWRITAVLGAGGMGTVYEAHRDDGQYQQRVALKCIRQELTSPALVDAFLNERNTLAKLDHAGIAPLLDGGIDAHGFPWFAMRYVEGQTIEQWCDGRRRSVRQRIELVLQACDALAYAHQRRVLHQDIKPSNLLVTVDGQVQVVDFGLAATLAGDRPLPRIAVSHGYAAPESLSQDRPTTALDVYSLGAVMYQLLCGSLPARVQRPLAAHAGGLELASQLAREAPPAVAQARGEASSKALARRLAGDLDAILARCCAAEPARRYASAVELGEELRRWLRMQPVQARQGGAGYRTATFVRRHRLACALSALVVATLGAGAAAAYLQAQRVAREAESSAALSAIFEQTLGNATLSGLGQDTFSSRDLLAGTEAQIRGLELHAYPRVMARGLLTLARNHAVIGDYRKAAALADEAARLPDSGGVTALEVQATRASLQNLAGHPEQALLTARAALDAMPGGDTALLPARLQLMTESARAQWDLGRQAPAWDTLDRALALARAQQAAHPSAYVELLALRGLWHVRMQRYADGDADLRQAIALAGAAHPLLKASAQRTLVRSLAWQQRFDESSAVAESLLQGTQRVLGDAHPQTATALILLGNTRCNRSDLEGCRDAIDRGQAAILRAVGKDHPDYGVALGTRALLEIREGKREEALATTREAYAILRRHYPPDHEMIIGTESYMAGRLSNDLENKQGAERAALIAEAERLYQGILDTTGRKGLPPPPQTRYSLARLLIRWGAPEDLPRAEALLAENRDALARLFPPEHFARSHNQLTFGLLYQKQGRLDEADALYAEMQAQARAGNVNAFSTTLQYVPALRRAEIASRRGHPEQAIGLLRESLALLAARFPEGHAAITTTRQAIDDLERTGTFRTSL